ncbi:aminoacyl-tRNA hydrolase [Paenibacillus turpanensis]|uniref:aminoacyl-tRNA hydrolase n=1 Tax=Paenibacillus turpanensis TaxID=2689078 RepID=UPI001409E59A|nr:aminoacyl-tRNA hydrolase [Paenibacillus turpanensis]
MQKPNESNLVQYYVVNRDLQMSDGKIAAQVAHAAVTVTLHCLFQQEQNHDTFQAWLSSGQKKIVLGGSEEQVNELANAGYLSIRDAGHTEVPSGSLTVVALPPMEKEEAQRIVSGLKLL